MTDRHASGAPAFAALNEGRDLAFIVYGLYLLGLINGLTIVVGLVVAYANRDGAGPRVRSHYVFQIRTFWTAIAWWIIGGALILLGLPLSLVFVGIPMIMLGGLIFGVGHVWFGVRCLAGLVYLARDEAYPRPRAWLF
jgi:uncharacterized membrane protein